MAEIKIHKNASRALDQHRTVSVSCVSSLHATWFELDGPSPIQWPQLKCDDSHICISLER